MPASTPVVARTSFAVGRRIIREGQLLSADDPAVKSHPALFDGADEVADRQVERATAAPGEKRTVRKATARKITQSDEE